MASATKTATKTVTHLIQEVTLHLTPREALVLKELLGHHVCGPTGGPRSDASAIFYALMDAKIPGQGALLTRERHQPIALEGTPAYYRLPDGPLEVS